MTPANYKVKHTYTSNSTLRELCKRNENICLQRAQNKNVHISFIHSSQKLETAQVFINKRMDKQTGTVIQLSIIQQRQRRNY